MPPLPQAALRSRRTNHRAVGHRRLDGVRAALSFACGGDFHGPRPGFAWPSPPL